MLATAQQMPDDCGGVWADAGRPVAQTLWVPASDGLMVSGHVFIERGMGAAPVALCVRGDTLAAMEDLDRRCGVTKVNLFARKAMWDRVVMTSQFDVIVDVFCG